MRLELVEQWEGGSVFPTRGQFATLAKLLKRPTAVFFLQEPPLKPGVATTFRHAPGLGQHELEQSEIRQLRWASRLQEIASWVLQDSNSEPADVRTYSAAEDPMSVGIRERKMLNLSIGEQLNWSTPNKAFESLRHRLESLGVFVMQLSLGRNNIRGFSKWSDIAPIVAVNESYHPTARVFSIMHEYGHLITRNDAACFEFIDPAKYGFSIERWCEQFAAAFLLPSEALRAEVSRLPRASRFTAIDVQTVRRIANRFSVSIRATAIRLEELEIVERGFYQSVASQLGLYDWNPVRKSGGGGGERAPEKRIRQFGDRLPGVLMDATNRGRLTDRDLADFLKLNTGQIDDLKVSLIERT